MRLSKYFRISITSRCNLSCEFCHREGNLHATRKQLTPEEIALACEAALECGFLKFKITGGEPTVRPDLCRIISLLSGMSLPDLSMITNGTNLKSLANELWEAGLRRLNVTLNTLNPQRFRQFDAKGQSSVQSVIDGIDTALSVGFQNMKINFVYSDEDSADDLSSLLQFAKERNVTLVVLPVISPLHHFSLDDMYHIISSYGILSEDIIEDKEGLLKRKITLHSGASVLLRLDELKEHQPFIFCPECENKSVCREGIFPIRLSANGELYPCIADTHRISILEPLQNRDRKAIINAFHQIDSWVNFQP